MPVSVLCFRGLQDQSWRLSALVVVDGNGPPPSLELAEAEHPRVAYELARRCGRSAWRYDFELPLAATQRAVDYHIGGRQWRIHLPAIRGPLRIAFTACNGFEAERTGSQQPVRNELWRSRSPERFYDALDWLYGWRAATCLAGS